ncbi:hypothetical protein NDU88_004467 [Pleurodeles waltl]|uniref:Uncharacterized protein n=1 Tax=Pleurodeles waltl TaxID=8319 RepID=A0AAV7WUB0_PLEWA|nr:hypothetical protein NDU88_004467 [Pleurodeles waltl]
MGSLPSVRHQPLQPLPAAAPAALRGGLGLNRLTDPPSQSGLQAPCRSPGRTQEASPHPSAAGAAPAEGVRAALKLEKAWAAELGYARLLTPPSWPRPVFLGPCEDGVQAAMAVEGRRMYEHVITDDSLKAGCGSCVTTLPPWCGDKPWPRGVNIRGSQYPP